MKCLFGHKWKGCKCERCGKTRDEGHNWNLCAGVCNVCEKKCNIEHNWNSIDGQCAEKCSRCEIVRDLEHQWKTIGRKKICIRCGIEKVPTHYVAIAISNCASADKERVQRLNDMLIGEYRSDPVFSKLKSKEWQYVEKVLTHPTSEFNVMRVALEWIAKEVGIPSTKLVEEQEKKLFVIKTPVPLGPSLWAVAHYFCE